MYCNKSYTELRKQSTFKVIGKINPVNENGKNKFN